MLCLYSLPLHFCRLRSAIEKVSHQQMRGSNQVHEDGSAALEKKDLSMMQVLCVCVWQMWEWERHWTTTNSHLSPVPLSPHTFHRSHCLRNS